MRNSAMVRSQWCWVGQGKQKSRIHLILNKEVHYTGIYFKGARRQQQSIKVHSTYKRSICNTYEARRSLSMKATIVIFSTVVHKHQLIAEPDLRLYHCFWKSKLSSIFLNTHTTTDFTSFVTVRWLPFLCITSRITDTDTFILKQDSGLTR